MKNTKYAHISKAERLEINILQKKGYSLRDIASSLGRNPSSLSREIKKNSVKGVYDPSQANQKAKTRRRNSKYQGMKVRRDLSLGHYLEEKLEDDWSPEAISGRIREIDKQIQYISPKGIYKFIDSVYGQFFEKHLAYKEKRKNKRKYTKITQLQDRTFIDKRPKIVEKRRRFGDWEGDFIVSSKNGKGVLLVLYERKSRYILLKKIVDCKMEIVYQLIFELTGNIIMNTLTLDNDIIFKKHKELSEILGLPLYFCHPYHFWEKGGGGKLQQTNQEIYSQE